MLLLYSPLNTTFLQIFLNKRIILVWEKAQLVMCFLCKREDTYLYRQFPCKKSHVAVHALGRKEKGGLWACKIRASGALRNLVSKNEVESNSKRDPTLAPSFYKHAYSFAYIQKHVHTHM